MWCERLNIYGSQSACYTYRWRRGMHPPHSRSIRPWCMIIISTNVYSCWILNRTVVLLTSIEIVAFLSRCRRPTFPHITALWNVISMSHIQFLKLPFYVCPFVACSCFYAASANGYSSSLILFTVGRTGLVLADANFIGRATELSTTLLECLYVCASQSWLWVTPKRFKILI